MFGCRLSKTKAPLTSVVTGVPTWVPFRNSPTLTPAIPGSVASWRPLPFVSSNTRSPAWMPELAAKATSPPRPFAFPNVSNPVDW